MFSKGLAGGENPKRISIRLHSVVIVPSTITHGRCLQWPHINMHGRGIKEIPLANLPGSLQGKLATGLGSTPVTQIPASCESLRKGLAAAPWGLGSIFKRNRLRNWSPGSQGKGKGRGLGSRAAALPASLLSL